MGDVSLGGLRPAYECNALDYSVGRPMSSNQTRQKKICHTVDDLVADAHRS